MNTWEGVEWFARDAWRELLDWVLLLDLIDGGTSTPATAGRLVGELLAAGEASRYRVDAASGEPRGADASHAVRDGGFGTAGDARNAATPPQAETLPKRGPAAMRLPRA